MATDPTPTIDRYLAENSDAPLTRESLVIALHAVRADLAATVALIKSANEKALAIDAIKPLATAKRDYVIAAVAACGGNVRMACRALKMAPATVYRVIDPRRRPPDE